MFFLLFDLLLDVVTYKMHKAYAHSIRYYFLVVKFYFDKKRKIYKKIFFGENFKILLFFENIKKMKPVIYTNLMWYVRIPVKDCYCNNEIETGKT